MKTLSLLLAILTLSFFLQTNAAATLRNANADFWEDYYRPLTANELRYSLRDYEVSGNMCPLSSVPARKRTQTFVPSNQTLANLRISLTVRNILNRTRSQEAFDLAYNGAVYITENYKHTISYVGTFQNHPGGYQGATEYGLLGMTTTIQVLADPVGYEWEDDNTVVITAYQGGNILFDVTLGDYTVKARGFTLQTVFHFEPGTIRAASELSIVDSDWPKLTDMASGFVPNFVICNFLMVPRCNKNDPIDGRNYMQVDAGYANAGACQVAMDGRSAHPTVCPYPLQSHTARCGLLHLALADRHPEIHCAHTNETGPVCQDGCLVGGACSDPAPANAKCLNLAQYDDIYYSVVPHYDDICKNGYRYENGACQLLLCDSQDKCPSSGDSYVCNPTTRACECNPTFINNPYFDPSDNSNRDYCVCPDKRYHVEKNVTSGLDVCVLEGRCFNGDVKMCPQNPTTVSCTDPPNTFTIMGNCKCNPGYDGGLSIDCTCPEGKEEEWSQELHGKICV
jgi:hypothetical protein